MARRFDAVNGSVIKLIFAFSIPLILTTILQNIFNIADKAVLGNMAGTVAVASIGATGTITSLIINGAVGLSSGATIMLTRYIGQRDAEKIRRTVSTSLISSIGIGVVFAVVGILLAPAFLRWTNCPEQCYSHALIYIRIYLGSAPIILLYNYGSAILRAFGDTQRPLIFISIAGVINVVLNVILCLILKQKVMAVAIATCVSQAVSAVLVLRRICRPESNYQIRVSEMRFHLHTFGQMLRFGVPSALSNLLFPLSNLQITAAINSYGPDAVAGLSASASINDVIHAFNGGFGVATSTFMGQNIGAKKPDRVKASFLCTIGLGVLFSTVLGTAIYFSGELWLKMILGSSSEAAVEYGMKRMLYVTLFMAINAVNNVLTHSLQAFGYPLFTSLSNIAFTLGFRTFWMQLVYPKSPSVDMIMLCFTVSWSLNMLVYIAALTPIFLRYTRKGICKKI